MHKEKTQTAPSSSKKSLPPEAQKYFDNVLQEALDDEKKEYHNPMVPFNQYAEKIKEAGLTNVSNFAHQLHLAKQILKKELENEEKRSKISHDATFQSYEEAVKHAKDDLKNPQYTINPTNTLQENCKISWQFMDRAFQAGKKCIHEHRFDEAVSIFIFLRYYNPKVFEYWLYEAICLQTLGNYPSALLSYGFSLMIQPKNPYVFFQMAKILSEMNEVQSSLNALDIAIDYAKDDESYRDIVKMASNLKEKLKTNKVS